MTSNTHRYPTKQLAAHAAGLESLANQLRRDPDADKTDHALADELDRIAAEVDDVVAMMRDRADPYGHDALSDDTYHRRRHGAQR